jgi:nucleotide-binding universal stress UspA family protein
MSPAPSPRVLAVLDDAAVGALALELSTALARAMQRDLSVVYVQSTRSLVAAALPFTQVLSAAGLQWVPLSEQDVEHAYHAQATRLRELAARITSTHAVSWSLRVMRGNMPEAAHALSGESDLLLMATAAPLRATAATAARRLRRRPLVAVVSDGSPASERALQVATQLAQALGGTLQVARVEASEKLMPRAHALADMARSDVLVLPRAPGALQEARCPILLVG